MVFGFAGKAFSLNGKAKVIKGFDWDQIDVDRILIGIGLVLNTRPESYKKEEEDA